MVNSTFKHNDPDSCHQETLSLHDCVAEKACYSDGVLRFFLPDGFWITSQHPENPLDKTVRTDAAVVDFSIKDPEDITIRVFKKNIFKKTMVESWNIYDLIAAINNGNCTLEFLYQYRTFFEQMWCCVIHTRKKPYYRECQLFLPETSAVFYWNDLRPEREW